MATKSYRFKDGVINLKPQGSTPSNTKKGDLFVDNADGLPVIVTVDASSGQKLVTETAIQTLTNKTLNAPEINNPTGLTKNDVGLGNVDNTSDANKPVSTAMQSALDTKQPLDSDLTEIAGLSPSNDDIIQRKAGVWTNRTPAQYKVDLNLTKSDIGLGNVDNTSDATKNAAVATLENKTIVSPTIEDYMDFTEESINPSTPASGKIRLYAKDDGNLYYKDDTGTEYLVETESSEEIQLVARPGSDYSGFTNILIPQFPWEDPQYGSNTDTNPTGTVLDVAWSPNGEFVACAHSSSPYITVYQKQGTSLVKLTNPATLPTSTANSVAWSPNGEFLAVGHDFSTRSLSIYQRSGSTLTKLTDGASWPGGSAKGVAWAPNGEYLACAHDSSPYLSVYRRSGTSFTKLTNPATLPTATGTSVAFTPGGTRIWFMQTDTGVDPILREYAYSSSAVGTQTSSFTNSSMSPPASNWSKISLSPDSYYMAVTDGGTRDVVIFDRTGGSWVKNQTINVGSVSNACYKCDYSLNGKYLAVGCKDSPYVYIYSIEGSTYTKLDDPSVLLSDRCYGISFSNDNQFLGVGFNAGDLFGFYQTNGEMPEIGIGRVIGYYKNGTLR